MFTIYGHKKIVEGLTRAIHEQRLPHALLFAGPAGIGKTEMAKDLAEVLKGEAVFTFWLQPGTGQMIKIDDLRAIKPKLYLQTAGTPKIVVIEPADQMTLACANALLKILEEPPANTYFILITAIPTQMPATIRSRCQRIDFSPFTEAEIASFLQQRGMNVTEAITRARWGNGSIRRALEWSPEFHQTLQVELDHCWKASNMLTLLQFCEKWGEAPQHLVPLLEILAQSWHQKIVTESGVPPNNRLWRQWQNILAAQRASGTTANKQLLLEQLMLELTHQ